MRKTLHTVSCELAPILHRATLAYRLSDAQRQYVFLDVNESQKGAIREKILQGLEGRLLPARRIENDVLWGLKKGDRRWQLLIRLVLKEMWEEGVLCYLNLSDRLGGEERRYGILSREFPALDLNEVEADAAQRKLVTAHVQSYGPVTTKDIAWWSGLSSRRVLSVLSSLKRHIVSVSVEGFSEEFFISKSNLEKIMHLEGTVEPWAELLAYEDPSLKGYYQSRRRYIQDAFAPILFNQIGEARASIVCSGEIVGIWELDQIRRRIQLRLFRPLSANESQLVNGAVSKLLVFLQNETERGARLIAEDWGCSK